MKKKICGFTLIEMLVVAAIAGVLATIGYVNFQDARAAARDDIRKSQLLELEVAIELYRERNGRYPEAGCGVNPHDSLTNPTWAGSELTYTGNVYVEPCVGEYIEGLVPDFIDELPSEIGGERDNRGFVYSVNSARSDYKVLNHHNVEQKFISDYGDEFARYGESCRSTFGVSFPDDEKDVYAIYSPGAACW
jgi:general secretion pathway protein G